MTALVKLINNLEACGQRNMADAVDSISSEGSDIATVFQSRLTHRGGFSQVSMRKHVPMADTTEAAIARATWIWMKMRAGAAKWDATALIMNSLGMTAEDQDKASRHADELWAAFILDRDARAREIALLDAETNQ